MHCCCRQINVFSHLTRPPGRGLMIFSYTKRYFPHYFSSLAINFKHFFYPPPNKQHEFVIDCKYKF